MGLSSTSEPDLSDTLEVSEDREADEERDNEVSLNLDDMQE